MAQLFVRLDDDLYDWLQAQKDESGLSLAKVVGSLLAAAREKRWRVGRIQIDGSDG